MTLGHEKLHFINTPTPLTRLDSISADLGIDLYLKRDDLTDYGTGGNKLRKLEYLVRDAQDQGATMLLTVGGAQTNHGRLTGAVAAKCGMKAAIVAVDPYPGEISANLLLDGIMGCPVYLVQEDGVHTEDQLQDMAVEKVTKEWESRGEKVYFIPVGGSNELGILGYYDCAVELAQQTEEMGLSDVRAVSTVGSMGTYMGMAVGIRNENLPMRLTGIGISPKPNGLTDYALKYYARVKKYFGLELEMTAEDFDLTSDYDHGAYNNPVKEVRDAIYYMGRKEGIILDPCYTGKTFAGIVSMVKEGKIRQGETVIMLHTGGIPGIYTKHHRLEMEKELKDYIHII
ncbi:MAG: 1-aminocyclopropane-1-carboxylate deaminase/D-cysteine desulfhydrase [Emergencia sp.]